LIVDVETIAAGEQIAIDLRNISGTSMLFEAVLVGVAAESYEVQREERDRFYARNWAQNPEEPRYDRDGRQVVTPRAGRRQEVVSPHAGATENTPRVVSPPDPDRGRGRPRRR
jgi:hypothetical protein